MAERRERRLWTSGLAIILLTAAAPLAAQTAPPASNSATPAPTPTPAPADGSSVGPPQLRDFNLNGTVTRPAAPVTNPAPPPSPDRPAAQPNGTARPAPAPARTTPPVPGPDRDSASETVAVDLPEPAPADSAAVEPGVFDAPIATAPTPAPAAEGEFPWPWLIAALAVALAGAFFLWRKRQAPDRPSYAGVSELVSPEPVSEHPQATPAPAPRAAAPPPPAAKPPAPKPAANGGIVASGLRPQLAFELHPIRAEADGDRGAALLFDVIVVNQGHAPARDVLVEAQLLNAGPQQDEQIGRFFREPVGQGERLAVIPPMGRISIKSRLAIPGDKMQPIEVDGRLLFVPLVAFNALYRWSGGDEQESASFLVGRGKEEGGKMAPFRLDQGAKSWTGLGARPHSMGVRKQSA